MRCIRAGRPCRKPLLAQERRVSAIIPVMVDHNIAEQRDVKVRTQLTRRLVTEDCMAEGLASLLSAMKRYTLLIERSKRDPQTGKAQLPEIILFESDPPLLRGKLDSRLLSAQTIRIFVSTEDRGTAIINLTERQVYRWKGTPEISQAIDTFDSYLKAGARSLGNPRVFVRHCLLDLGRAGNPLCYSDQLRADWNSPR